MENSFLFNLTISFNLSTAGSQLHAHHREQKKANKISRHN